jgi:hypothetical protein
MEWMGVIFNANIVFSFYVYMYYIFPFFFVFTNIRQTVLYEKAISIVDVECFFFDTFSMNNLIIIVLIFI